MLSVTNFALSADNSYSDGDQYDWLRDGRYQAAEEVHCFTTFPAWASSSFSDFSLYPLLL